MRPALSGFLVGFACAVVLAAVAFYGWRGYSRANARVLPLAAVAEETVSVPRGDQLLQSPPPEGWKAHTLQIGVLQDVTDLLAPGQSLSARAYLAWNEGAFLARVEVDTPVTAEAPTPKNLEAGDSVELHLFAGEGESRRLTVIVSPGLDPLHPQPRVAVPSAPPYEPYAGQVLRGVEKTADGYAVTLAIPWSIVGGTPKPGAALAAQLVVNRPVAKVVRHFAWFPHADTGGDSRRAVPLRLAEKPSRPVTTLARVDILTPHVAQAVFTFARNTERPGHKLAILHGDDTLAREHFKTAPDSWSHIFSLPEGWGVTTPVRLVDNGRLVALLSQNDAMTQLHRLTQGLGFTFEPSVFTTRSFPTPVFLQDPIIRHAYAPVVVKTTFYNARAEVVKDAATPGRYGAVAEIEMAGGLKMERYVTLYRAAAKPGPADKTMFTVSLPPAYGINPAILQEQAQEVSGGLTRLFTDSFRTSTSAAVLLAGLSETRPGEPPAVKRLDAASRDAEWWYALRSHLNRPRTYDYNVALPEGYAADPTKKWPLILFLHGVGRRDALQVVSEPGLPSVMGRERTLPALVVSPQCPDGEWWNSLVLGKLIEEVSAKYHVDEDRVIVTGLSMGGFGSWALALAYPERFAAVVPICGGGDPADAARLRKLPIWAFHGGRDPVVPVANSINMVKAVNAAGGHAHLTLYPDEMHDCWYSVYHTEVLYTWMLAQKRNQPEVAVPGVPAAGR